MPLSNHRSVYSMKIKPIDNCIEIRNDKQWLVSSVLLILLAVGMTVLWISLLPTTPSGLTGIGEAILVIAFICALFGLGCKGVFLHTRTLILDDRGVTLRTLIGSTFLAWEEIQDWGLSYYEWIRFEGNTYDLYYSKSTLATRKKNKKALKGVAIKLIVLQNEYDDVTEKVVAFSRDHTAVEPFISS